MATLAAPNREILIAMQELGVDGWLRGSRVRVRVRRDEPVHEGVQGKGERGMTKRTSGTVTDPREMVGMVGLGVLAAGTAVWAFQRYEDSTAVSRVLTASRSPSAASLGRTIAAAATMLLGVGALAAAALGLIGRRSQR